MSMKRALLDSTTHDQHLHLDLTPNVVAMSHDELRRCMSGGEMDPMKLKAVLVAKGVPQDTMDAGDYLSEATPEGISVAWTA